MKQDIPEEVKKEIQNISDFLAGATGFKLNDRDNVAEGLHFTFIEPLQSQLKELREEKHLRWVKASDRLPETNKVTSRYIDTKQPLVSNLLDFLSFYTKESYKIEWLDESHGQLPQDRREYDVVEVYEKYKNDTQFGVYVQSFPDYLKELRYKLIQRHSIDEELK
jgi:hypothetical protein